MFIGDGMSYPQIQVTQDYYSAIRDTNNNDILEANSFLNFTHFDAAGSAITYDSTSFCPDSASTAAYYAHQASCVAMLMVFTAQGTPLVNILNYKYVAAEIVHIVAGSIGLTAVAPLTAILGGTVLCYGRKKSAE